MSILWTEYHGILYGELRKEGGRRERSTDAAHK